MVYGYCRVSTKHQRITRQVTNITELNPEAVIIKEFYTGTTQNRPLWDRLMKQINVGDTIIFDMMLFILMEKRMMKHSKKWSQIL